MEKCYDELTFTDDYLFGKILCDDPELCREFAEMILARKISKIQGLKKYKQISITADGFLSGIRVPGAARNGFSYGSRNS